VFRAGASGQAHRRIEKFVDDLPPKKAAKKATPKKGNFRFAESERIYEGGEEGQSSSFVKVLRLS